jgi:protein TonB
VIRFLSLSLLFHVLLLAPLYFLLKPRDEAAVAPTLLLSEGEAFVGKSPLSGPEPTPAPTPPSLTQAPAFTSAAEVAPVVSGSTGASLGTPDGEARLGEGVTLVYPAMSVRLGESGIVTVSVEVSATGQATGAKIIRSSGFSRLDQAALEVLSKAPFAPATKNGESIQSRKEITVNFQLNNTGAAAQIGR